MVSASLVKELREITGAGMLDCKKALEESNCVIEDAVTWLREKGISKAAKKADRVAAEGLSAILVDGNDAVIIEVNSETDFVAKNEEFKTLVNDILNAIIKNDPKTTEDVLALTSGDCTIDELIINKTATIGEKLSFRRFSKVSKNDSQVFGAYSHMGGKISVLTVLSNTTDEVAKSVAMHAAAMSPVSITRNEVSADLIEKEKEIAREIAINEGKDEKHLDAIINGKIQKYYQESCLEEQSFILDDKISVGAYVKNNGGSIDTMVRFAVGEGIEKVVENFAEEVAKQING